MLQARNCINYSSLRTRKISQLHRICENLSSNVNISVHPTIYCRHFASSQQQTTKVSKNNLFWKITGGIVVLCGGGAAAGAYMYSTNPDFRKFVNKSLPIIETFNLALGPISNSNSNNEKGDEIASMTKVPDTSGTSPKEVVSHGSDLKHLTEIIPKETQEDILSESKHGKKAKPVASVSSVDQASISSVDLAIAESVEGEVGEVAMDTVVKPNSVPGGGDLGERDRNIASVSVLDQAGVSSVDIDIAQIAEKDVAEASGNSPSSSNSDRKEDAIDISITEKEATNIAEQASLEVMIDAALANLKELGHKAIQKQSQAADVVRRHIKHLKDALEHTGREDQTIVKTDLEQNVITTHTEAEENIASAQAAILLVNEEVEKVRQLIKEAEAVGAKEAAAAASESAARISYELQTAATKVQKANAETVVLGEHQKQLEQSREMFKKELQAIMPEVVRENSEQIEENKEGLSSNIVLLAYARKRVEQLKQQLAEQNVQEQKRLERALELQREQDNTLAQMVLQQEMDKLKADFASTLSKKETELVSKHESELRQQLRRQAAAYSDHLSEVLKVQAGELDRKYREELEQSINREKDAFDLKLQSMLARLQGVEAAVESRAEVERRNKEAQELWLACQSLSAAVSSQQQGPQSVASELNAIRESSRGNPVITHVLGSIPEEASIRGVVSESHLQRNFSKIRRACRRLAMVEGQDSGIWTHILSYIQSFLIFDSFDPVKEGESVDLENIDTFGLLARADYYLHHGDLELAARFMNQLTGEPRRIAKNWVREARLLLETKQAAEFLAAYAASEALGGI